jgi:4-hydroxy-3-methylbut-2-enyl diphosphate reductase
VNRSVERRRFGVSGMGRGQVVVGAFDHPVRGPVRSPAAPLIAAAVRRRGLRVREEPVEVHQDTTAFDGVMFTVSYLDRTGAAVGFGAAAHVDDHVGLVAARAAVDGFGTVLRTRRLLIGALPALCGGASRALQLIDRRLASDARPITVVGVLDAGPSANADLRRRGVSFTDDVTTVAPGGTVVFPAHGVAPATRAAAGAAGVDVIDATCPLVREMQSEVRRFAAQGDRVILVGRPGPAALTPLTGEAPGDVTVVESVDEVTDLPVDHRQVSYVVPGGVPVERMVAVIGALRSRHPRLRGQHPDGWCYAASDRTETTRAIAAACDVVFVLGETGSTDSRDLARVAGASGTRVHRIASAVEIRRDWLDETATVGLVTTSAMAGLDGGVIEVLSGLGPLAVVHRGTATHPAKVE